MPRPLGSIQALKANVSRFLDVARERHRRGDNPFRVVEGFSDGVDGVLRHLFLEELGAMQDDVALLAVGGYGRRQLCPHSDVDLLFLRESPEVDDGIRRLVTLLWDGGFDLGHSVRTVADCYRFMADDVITAAALLEHRFLIGSRRLLARFEERAIRRYRKRHGETFARQKLEQLRESLESPKRTIYVVEPHLKDGVCGLRDIQRVLWIESIRRELGTFDALQRGGVFSSDRVDELRDAYGFYLRVRCENHFTNGIRQDVLDGDSVFTVACHLGYGDSPCEAVEGLMADYYRHARNTWRFLQHYVETGTQGRRFHQRLAHKILATQVRPYLSLYQGTLFLRSEPQVDDVEEEISGIFLEAFERDCRLSAGLREWIRQKVADPDLDFAYSSAVHGVLLAVLRGSGSTGRVLKAMHWTGFLGRLVPEFQALEGRVTFDGHHQFTVDEHILRTLQALDDLEGEADREDGEDSKVGEEDAEFRRIFASIEDRLSLRLALLLHDIGKALPGDHEVSGQEAASLVCERLGVPQEVEENVEFLVYHHLRMFEVSERQDFTDDEVVEVFARLVGTIERLEMLYLLTYIDIRAVGPGTWTAWKGVQLAELYQRTRICIETGTTSSSKLEEALAVSHLSTEQRARVVEHCETIDSPSYAKNIVPERMLYHADMVDRYLQSEQAQIDCTSFVGYHEVTVCTRDRSHLFAQLTGVLHSEGLGVLGASIFSRRDGVALDVFFVEIADDIRVGIEQRVERVRSKMRAVESRQAAVADLILRRERTYGRRLKHRRRKSLLEVSVEFDNGQSSVYTVIEVSAGDRPGLLHSIASTLDRLGLDVRTAKVSTVSDRAHDMFWVFEADGEKVTNPARLALVKQDLQECVVGPTDGEPYQEDAT